MLTGERPQQHTSTSPMHSHPIHDSREKQEIRRMGVPRMEPTSDG
jgi:hypothetical protein